MTSRMWPRACPPPGTAGYNGAGIGVAVIDSGINDSHPDLWNSTETHSRVVYHQDFTGTATSNSSGGKYDLYGHGTHVAGIIGGNGYLSGGNYVGVAPGGKSGRPSRTGSQRRPAPTAP